MINWKNTHANESGKALETDLVKGVIEELLDNLHNNYGVPTTGLPLYGLHKVAMYAAQVARAQALGFDPELLRNTDEEADAQQIDLARKLVEAGVPTVVIVAGAKEVPEGSVTFDGE